MRATQGKCNGIKRATGDPRQRRSGPAENHRPGRWGGMAAAGKGAEETPRNAGAGSTRRGVTVKRKEAEIPAKKSRSHRENVLKARRRKGTTWATAGGPR